jgi:hypothetical protein
MDHEAIGQTIEWSLRALSDGTAGITRAEAEALLSGPPLGANGPPHSTPPDAPPVRRWRRKVDAWLPEVALLYAWTPHSQELFATQGPVFRIGFDHVGRSRQFGVAANIFYQYPERHAAQGVALELRTLGARLFGRYLALGLARGSGLGLRAGFGFDAVFSSPEALDRARFEAAESSQQIVPLVDMGLLWQTRVEPGVRLEVSLGTELDFVGIRYDVVTEDGVTPVVSRWPVRPSVSVGVAFF